MNSILINELAAFQNRLSATYQHQNKSTPWPFRHLILASRIPGIYSLGGDLEYFLECIEAGEAEQLRDYAYKCVRLLHRNIHNLDLPITMIALVQGQALGGGFESALSCDVIVAERSAVMGFPEMMFNLFPGMGAYNLLTRRIGPAMAERMIVSGRTYNASELYEMGVVDILANDGEGEDQLIRYLSNHHLSHNTIRSMKKIRQIVNPVTQRELYEIVDIWVEGAMNLSHKDLSKMRRMLEMQKENKISDHLDHQFKRQVVRRGDWRKVKTHNFPVKNHLGEYIEHDRRSNTCRRRAN